MSEAALPTCIFCDNPLDGSDEHIIPDSVNGRLPIKCLIGVASDQQFGSKPGPNLRTRILI